ncbi:MAG TPA: EamA family transporter RarD [Nocardioidaceae bacterium]|nr:EamA family transporter RarD [Nocardioidaceae bacterium]
MTEQRRGFILGATAYTLWGSFPLYWPLLEPAGPGEILAHRIVWSLVVVSGLLVLRRRVGSLRQALTNRRSMLALVIAAVVIGINWFTFIYGVNSGRVVETSLGYFINPLVTVLIGVLLLGERLRRPQWVALGVALVAVVWLAFDYGRPPWIALVLAFSFGTYGLAKKKANAGAVEGLAVESVVLAPAALLYLGFLHQAGQGEFTAHGWPFALLLTTTGIVTAAPLLCFGAAATRVSLTTIGMLQYITPSLQFAVGVLVYDEPMSPARWAGFVLVWIALAILTAEAISHRRRALRRAAVAAAA